MNPHMKTKSALVVAAALVILAVTAHAGPRIVISVNSGGYCAPRPVYYYRPAVVCRPTTIYRPLYIHRSAYRSGFHSGYRSSHSQRRHVAPTYRVQRPVYPTCRTTSFGWRR
jgi:hypothetical protein